MESAVLDAPEDDVEVTESTEGTGPIVLVQGENGVFDLAKPADFVPPDDAPDYVRQHYDAILEKERSVRILENDYLELKDQAAEAKKSFDRADKALRDLISRGPDPQKALPFPDEQQAAEAWRAAPLAELEMTDHFNDLLSEAGVATIGDLEDLRAKIADGKAEWPKGIGEAKVTDIENRVVDWLTENRDKFGEVVEFCRRRTPEEWGAAFEAAAVHLPAAEIPETIITPDEPEPVVAHKSNGHAKAKKRGFAGRPAKKSKAKKRK
jgi:hypothetical protein